MHAFMIHSRHSDRIDTIRVAIEITLIPGRGAIPTRKHENGSFSSPALIDPVEHGFLYEMRGASHGPPVIRRTPAAAVNRHVLVSIVERCSLVGVGYTPGEDSDAGDFRVVGNPDAASGVFDCGDLACAACTVGVIEEFGCRKVLVVIVVIRIVGILITVVSMWQ